MGLLQDFAAFLEEYGVVGLAIAFVMGLAVKDLVSAIVDDLIMPIVGLFLPQGAWETATINLAGADLLIGHLLSAVIDFTIIALLIFVFVKYGLREEKVEKI